MHTRIAQITFLEPVRVSSQEEYDELCRAIGRQILFGTENQDQTTMVTISTTRDHREHVAVYSRDMTNVVDADGFGWTYGESIPALLAEASTATGNMITIGAVRDDRTGKYSFHS